ncbi:hypothetical protein BASA50_002313 [Batrachochytrium salamandrivorans]|uniref:MHD domain-containing protein n=1 Tax=Batrachochytrium salamandrivorans TaxID=1357716 RepID=A0ABQ8FPL9_9FUNG|nr:hypothetical protein BASA60_004521 [Batrachochytrium salamandrivorans]KAH6600415.1 hypothetical protein BASA50_002313 [Batrachochytrium salamandrivorans]KAH9257456.1 hypothetical protein BASA81_004382 [Batrachochytrium salamandrivorans]KAH9267268.1 hypothetical protein BASA84_000750 [Batrachochytrium salamandrivorans]KAH9276717.1 hypothetical protein BASA83_000851 [Batrachochytrium salamandrivorans]
MFDSLFVVDNSGSVIIEKHWKQLIPRRVVDEFVVLVQGYPIQQEAPPVLQVENYYMLHINRHGLLFVSAVQTEVAPSSVFFFLHLIVELLSDYFGGISELILKENFVIVYELLEELVDYGSPYITEPSLLKEMIPPPSLLSSMMNAVSIGTQFGTKLRTGSISTIPWRSTGLKYTNNEIFFDVIEELDVVIDRTGHIVSGTIFGDIMCISKLSGMPDLLLTLGNKSVIPDSMTSLHPCVRVGRYERDKTLSFVPPDGSFRLMEYNIPITTKNQLPIHIRPVFKWKKGGGRLDVSMIPKISGEKIFEKLIISAKLPAETLSVRTDLNMGQCIFEPISKTLTWTIGKLTSGPGVAGAPTLTGHIVTENMTELPKRAQSLVFTVDFRINMYSASGVRIDSLTVQNEGYTPFKGGRGYTKAGRFQIRSY